MSTDYAAAFARSQRARARRLDAALQSRLDEAALIRATAAAELEAKAARRRMEAVRAQPWKCAQDSRVSPCPACGGWRWDGACRGGCKTLDRSTPRRSL